MTGKLFVGVNNKAVLPRSIYAGVNNIARKVSAAYVGDENNRAKKIWPVSVLPNGFKQLEYIDASTTAVDLRNEVRAEVDPRIIMSFEMTQAPGRAYSYDTLYFINGYYYSRNSEYAELTRYEYDFYCIPNYFIFGHNSPVSEWKSGGTNSTEGILLNKLYTLDFFPGDGIYLYNIEGYYSVSSHNKLVSIPQRYSGSAENTNVLELFKVNDTYAAAAHAKLYGAVIYDGSTIIKDLYPARKVSDGVYGFYDTVDRLFYPTLSSSHTINIGPEV